MSSFDSQPFPKELAALSVKSHWMNSVVIMGSGSEQRAVLWGDARRRYDGATAANMTLADYFLIEKHFNARRGRGRSFPLRDRTSFRALTESLGVAGGIGSTMQLAVASGDSGNAYSREIYLPESGTIHVYADAVEKTQTTDWTLAYTGATAGVLTWVTNQTGKTITWSGDYWIPVRYDVDSLPDFEEIQWTTGTSGIVKGASIPLLEVRYTDEY